MDSSIHEQPIMKNLKDLSQEKLQFLIEAVEGKPSRNTGGAIIKGELLIALAKLMDEKEDK